MTEKSCGRLAIRSEGDWWNAYYTLPNTMEQAVPLGSIRMEIVRQNPARKAEFMDLMRNVVSDLIEKQIGVRPVWQPPQSAFDAEADGRA